MSRPDHDPEMGQPIAELADFEEEHSDVMIRRVRSSLHRRLATNQFATMSWSAPGRVIIEFLEMLFSLFQRTGTKGEDR